MTIECSFEEFKRMAKEFRDAAPTLNLDELDNAWKCRRDPRTRRMKWTSLND